jgi:hypothetical protein
MAKKISQLNAISSIQETDLIAVVQNGSTQKATISQIENYLVPVTITASAGQTINLSDSTYVDSMLVRLSWSGVNGTMTLNLPSASANTNRVMRFISNGGFANATRVELTPINSETLDGSTSAYVINKEFEGIHKTKNLRLSSYTINLNQ